MDEFNPCNYCEAPDGYCIGCRYKELQKENAELKAENARMREALKKIERLSHKINNYEAVSGNFPERLEKIAQQALTGDKAE